MTSGNLGEMLCLDKLNQTHCITAASKSFHCERPMLNSDARILRKEISPDDL